MVRTTMHAVFIYFPKLYNLNDIANYNVVEIKNSKIGESLSGW